VAYFYLLPDYYVFRYRVYNMVQALQASDNGTSTAYFTQNDLSFVDRIVDIADVIVVCRTKYDQDINYIITRAHNEGKTVFFDVDDLVFDIKYIHLILETHDLDSNNPITWDNWFALKRNNFMGNLLPHPLKDLNPASIQVHTQEEGFSGLEKQCKQ
jgi:hypothetical protein